MIGSYGYSRCVKKTVNAETDRESGELVLVCGTPTALVYGLFRLWRNKSENMQYAAGRVKAISRGRWLALCRCLKVKGGIGDGKFGRLPRAALRASLIRQ